VGTSTSFRAPAEPRWQAFVVALQQQLPLERVRSELFNAGQEWEEALAARGVASFAVAIAQAWEDLPNRIRQAERPEQALATLAIEARAVSDLEEPTPALALAERAFTALLSRTAAGKTSLAAQDSEAAASEFISARGEPGQLVNSYVGELLGQYTKHIASREAGRLTEGGEGIRVGESRRLIRALAADAEGLSQNLPQVGADPSEVGARWRELIRDAFTRGRALPEVEQ